MAKIFRWICSLQIYLIATAAMSPCYGQITIAPNQEYKTKANFLVNFAKFTSWPEDILTGSDRFKLCVLGRDPFGLFLDLLAIRGVGGREIDLLRLGSSDQAADCHLLFLSTDAVSNEGRVPPALARRGLFIVTDTPGLAERGAVANLVMEDGTMRFEINVSAARRAALVLNTQLLRLGRLTTDADLESP
jgi:hypothetical protein